MGILLFGGEKDDIPLVCARSAPEKNLDFGLQFFAKISVTKFFCENKRHQKNSDFDFLVKISDPQVLGLKGGH